MTLNILAGWDHDVIGTASMEVTSTDGTYTASITTGKFCAKDLSPPLTAGDYDNFSSDLGGALNTASPSVVYGVSYDDATNEYTVSASAAFSINFAVTDGTLMRRILGFASDTQGSATSHVSDVVPYYTIETSAGCRSNDGLPYEPENVVLGGHTLGGSHFGIASSNPIDFWDWEIMFEPKAKTFIRDAPDGTTVGDHPWTYEHLWNHCRSAEPFLMQDSDGDDSIHYFRPRHAGWTKKQRRPDQPDYHVYWHLRFETFLKGYL